MSGGITVAELVTKWGFDIDPKALSGLEQKLGGITKGLGPVGKGIMVVGAAAAGIVSAVTAMVVTTARAGEEALKTSQKIGLNIERYQELSYAAKMADVANEEMTVSLKFLSSKLYDASNGSREAKKSLNSIGVSAKDSSGKLKSADIALAEIADKFESMPDGAKKTAVAVDLFGRGGIAMIPMLNKGSRELRAMAAEAHKLGLVMSEGSARRSEEFMDNLKRLQSVVVGIKREIGAAFLPALSKLAKGFLEWIIANRELISQKLTVFIQAFGSALTTLVPVLGRAIELGSMLFNLISNLTSGAGGLSNIFKILATSMVSPFLIIDDIVAYFQGKDSLFGRFIVLMQKELPILGGKIMQFFQPVEGIIRSIGEQLKYIWDSIVGITNAVTTLLKSPAKAFFDSLGAVWGMNRDFMGKEGMGGKLLSGLDPREMLASLNTAGAGQADFLRWMSPSMSPAWAPMGAMANGALGQMGLSVGDIVVNVNGGGNAAETGAAVGSAVKENLDKVLRQARRDLSKTVVR